MDPILFFSCSIRQGRSYTDNEGGDTVEMNDRRGCTAGIGSLTQTMRAQKALAASAIPSRVIKSDVSSRHGCAYALSFSCEQERNVRHVLETARISVKQWNGE